MPIKVNNKTNKTTLDHILNNDLHGDATSKIPYVASTGTANTYSITLSPAPTSYFEGMAVSVKINVANTGASTINVNGLGAKSITDILGNPVSVGDLPTGTIVTLRYNGTHFRIQSGASRLRVNSTTNKPEYFNGTTWVVLKGSYPVGNVTSFSASSGDTKITLKWNDPSNVTIVDSNGTTITVAEWAGTRIVRKTGSYPVNENDGVVVLNNGVQDQYLSTGYEDTGLVNGTTYYYSAFPYTIDNIFTVDVANRVSAVPQSFAVYGVSIDLANSNPLTSVTYTDNAVGMTKGSSAWDTMRIFKDCKPCVLLNGVVQYYLNPNDYTKKLDGSASDITSGSDGDVMIEIPKTGFKINTVGSVVTVQVTDNPANPDFKYYAHTRVTEGDRNFLYVGAYFGYNLSSKLRSLSGKTPTASQTHAQFRTLAQANGTGYDKWGFFQILLLQCLFLIKYGSLDSQTALGRGYVDGNSASITTGGTNAKGMYFGETTGKLQMKFLGIEDFWGNLYSMFDGLVTDASRNVLTAFTNFNDTGSGYTNRGQGATSDIGGYISKPQGTNELGFLCKEVSGSATTYFCDGGILYAGYLPGFGAYWSGASSSGVFRVALSLSVSGSAAYCGSRLMWL